MKLCECGCGTTAPIASRTNTKFGHIKGQPMRYLLGHNRHNRWPPTTLAERFWAKVRKTDSCWIWTGAVSQGYGRLGVDGKTKLATHVAYEMQVGPFPIGSSLLHDCDNPPCVRIDAGHVRLGTQAENMRDCSLRNRIALGARHGSYKHGKFCRRKTY